ncbi:MAG: ATP-dependent 6-phosphofructokinase [Elusimicrobia bacterium]|nr:ATP-dependent 6-phosphofructokinase [Elusimicrobiota bacterium]
MAGLAKGRKLKIALSTGGGDAPGLNAVIRAATKTAWCLGWEVWGIQEGFEGLIDPRRKLVRIDTEDIRGILTQGGTILGTANRGNPFKHQVQTAKGAKEVDLSATVVRNFKKLGFDALIVIGGEGTLGLAYQLVKKGIPIVGVPKTIDNDLPGTDITFGFDTAVSVATEAIGRLHSTAQSHRRCFVVELMGRYAGWITLNAGVSGGADVILIPEIPFDIDAVCDKVLDRERRKKHFSIVVAAEGAQPKGGARVLKEGATTDHVERLGGIAEWVAKEIDKRTGKETRSLVLGHLQRGGTPTTFDRLLATRLGSAAVRCVARGQFGRMVALKTPKIVSVPLTQAIKRLKTVPLDHDTITSARSMGISFGDRLCASGKGGTFARRQAAVPAALRQGVGSRG